jgi:hypothetical protein
MLLSMVCLCIHDWKAYKKEIAKRKNEVKEGKGKKN